MAKKDGNIELIETKFIEWNVTGTQHELDESNYHIDARMNLKIKHRKEFKGMAYKLGKYTGGNATYTQQKYGVQIFEKCFFKVALDKSCNPLTDNAKAYFVAPPCPPFCPLGVSDD